MARRRRPQRTEAPVEKKKNIFKMIQENASLATLVVVVAGGAWNYFFVKKPEAESISDGAGRARDSLMDEIVPRIKVDMPTSANWFKNAVSFPLKITNAGPRAAKIDYKLTITRYPYADSKAPLASSSHYQLTTCTPLFLTSGESIDCLSELSGNMPLDEVRAIHFLVEIEAVTDMRPGSPTVKQLRSIYAEDFIAERSTRTQRWQGNLGRN